MKINATGTWQAETFEVDSHTWSGAVRQPRVILTCNSIMCLVPIGRDQPDVVEGVAASTSWQIVSPCSLSHLNGAGLNDWRMLTSTA